MTAFIRDQRTIYGVEPICRVLPIAPSTFYVHDKRRRHPELAPPRVRRDERLKPEILRVFNENHKVYGVRKIWRQLLREGFDVARCTIARLMKDMQLQGVRRGKKKKTTQPDKALPCPLDKVNRGFKASAPNQLWVSDFTYVSTWQGFVYVAFIIDVFARKIVGWRTSRTANASFVLDALEQALYDRRPVSGGGLIHHSDRAANISRSNILKGWLRRGWSHLSAASATAMITLWLKQLMVSIRQKLSTVAVPGNHVAQSNMPRSNGSTGSTIDVCWNPSATSHQQKQRRIITQL